ncbi:MAG: radical SAM protein [Clostridia bacterium]|nr:radical SAM protein [Clostridia bacterium]
MDILARCNLCPRGCLVDRQLKTGFCKAPKNPKVARAALHYWEEPCISGNRGSGTVFFSGCNLKCVYCQNYDISEKGFGKEITVSRLSEIFLELQQKGAHNINLVSPTPYVPQIIEAVDMVRGEIKIPFVYNTGGYESLKTLDMMKDYIDIFLTDIKYKEGKLAAKYSHAEDYFEVALSAAQKMIDMKGLPRFDKDGIMKSGVIVRHLVLPGYRKDSIDVLNAISQKLPEGGFLISLMSQYTPDPQLLKNYPKLCRKVTTFEYKSVVDEAIRLEITKGYMQQKSSAEQKYTPPFDLSGV